MDQSPRNNQNTTSKLIDTEAIVLVTWLFGSQIVKGRPRSIRILSYVFTGPKTKSQKCTNNLAKMYPRLGEDKK